MCCSRSTLGTNTRMEAQGYSDHSQWAPGNYGKCARISWSIRENIEIIFDCIVNILKVGYRLNISYHSQ